MKTTVTNSNLEELLARLPALSLPCHLCYSVNDPEPAVLREPSTGNYLCARCVMEHIAGWPGDRDGIEQVVRLTLRAGTLSRRETEVLRWLAQGYSDTEIARKMCIECPSVSGHVSHIKNKLGFRGRAQLILCALKVGLVDLADIDLRTHSKERAAL